MTDIALPILDYYTLAVQTAFALVPICAFAFVVWQGAKAFDAWLWDAPRQNVRTWDTEQCGWCERYQHLGHDSVCVVTRYARGRTIAVTHVRVCGACVRDLQLTRERVA